MAAKRPARPPPRRSAANRLRDRLDEAESTLEAIRAGTVDALVVAGPNGARTVAIAGATHPYFVLLNAMSDGAALLEPGGGILFGNRSFGVLAGVPVDALRGSLLQRFLAPDEQSQFEELVREAGVRGVSREFLLTTGKRSATPVTIALSTLPVDVSPETMDSPSGGTPPVLMAIITDLTYRKAAEATRARLLERVISAEDDERRRMARELHDETGQSLTALLVGLRTIADMSVRAEVREAALRLRDVAAQSVTDVARLARGMHPAVLDDKGLEAAARRYVADYARSFNASLDFTAMNLDAPRLPPLASATMYRILQEALTNVVRHARAAKVVVQMTRDESVVELLVQDDGVGFDTRGAGDAESAGLGLNGMRERVALLGGSIEIESRRGHGTIVRARIPASRPPPPPATASPVNRVRRS